MRSIRNTLSTFIRHINNAMHKLTMTNPIHREIYDSLTKDKQFLEELRKKAAEALDSLPSAQSERSVDNQGGKTYNKTKFSSKAKFNKLRSKVPIPKDQWLSVWNSIVERNIDFLRTKGNELPSEYYAYNDDYVYFYYNNSSTDFENFYVFEKIGTNVKNKQRIERRIKDLESVENAGGYSDLVSFASEDSEGRNNSDNTVYERKPSINTKNDSVFKTKGRGSSNHDISRSDGVRSQTGKWTDESVPGNDGGVKPDTKFSLKPASNISEEHRALIEENEKYKALIKKLNGQIHAMQKKVVDPKGVRKLARDVRAEFRSGIDRADPEQKRIGLT